MINALQARIKTNFMEKRQEQGLYDALNSFVLPFEQSESNPMVLTQHTFYFYILKSIQDEGED